jgi:hypothetical protein
LGDGTGHNVDLLPVNLNASSFRAADGAPAAFATGVVADTQIPCLSVAFQIEHHRMYRHRSTDSHDLRLLSAGEVVQ